MRAKLQSWRKLPIWRRYGRLILFLALLGSALASFAADDWRLELFSHFLPFYLLITLLGAVFWPRWRLILLLIALLLGWQLWWAIAADEVKTAVPNQVKSQRVGPLRVIAQNLFINNTQYQQMAQWLLAQQPDVVFLTEATPNWKANLSELQRVLPYGCAAWEDSPFGIAALLKSPPLRCEIIYSDQQYQLFPFIRIELANHTVLYGIHPPPPLGQALASARNQALINLANKIAQEKAPVIVLGDMNITPYSPLYQTFRRKAGLAEIGFAAWPTWSPILGVPLLPLDRALQRGLEASINIAPPLGSDHRAIVVDVK